MSDYGFLLAAVCGASIQELLYWWERRFDFLGASEKKRPVPTKAYWVIVAVAIPVFGAAAWAFFREKLHTFGDFLLVGAAFPALLKQAVRGVAKEPSPGGGPTLGSASAVREYFGL